MFLHHETATMVLIKNTQRSYKTYIFLARQKTNPGFQDLLIMHYKMASLKFVHIFWQYKNRKKNSQAQSHFAHFFLGIKELSTTYHSSNKQQKSVCSFGPPPRVQKHPMLILPLLIPCNILNYLLLKESTTCTYKTYKIYTYNFPSCTFRQSTVMIKE